MSVNNPVFVPCWGFNLRSPPHTGPCVGAYSGAVLRGWGVGLQEVDHWKVACEGYIPTLRPVLSLLPEP